MLNDIAEAPVLLLLMVLPTLVSVPIGWRAARRRRIVPVLLTLVSPLILAMHVAVWYVYSATDMISNPGLGGALSFIIMPLFLSWASIAAALLVVRHRRRTEHGSSSPRMSTTRATGRP